MIKALISKLKPLKKKQKTETENYLAQEFRAEVAMRSYIKFIRYYTRLFEANKQVSGNSINLPSHIQAHNVFLIFKNTGYLNEMNLPKEGEPIWM